MNQSKISLPGIKHAGYQEEEWKQRRQIEDLMGHLDIMVMVMVFNATFNTISAISWRSILLVEETGVPGEYHRPVASH